MSWVDQKIKTPWVLIGHVLRQAGRGKVPHVSTTAFNEQFYARRRRDEDLELGLPIGQVFRQTQSEGHESADGVRRRADRHHGHVADIEVCRAVNLEVLIHDASLESFVI